MDAHRRQPRSPRTSPLLEPLARLADAHEGPLRGPRRRLLVWATSGAVVVALLVARQGTWRARAVSVGAVAVVTILLALRPLVARRRWQDMSHVIGRLAGRVDPERAARARRALTLLAQDGDAKQDGTSPDLARLHVARALAALPTDRIASRAASFAAKLRLLGWVMFVAFAGGAISSGWRIFEGADVLLARHGRAPLPMQWLDDLELRARPPDYLHHDEFQVGAFESASLPCGTLLTFRGAPMRSGRRLVLTDGSSEVPFVDDGSGHFVARWPLRESASLRVVARFGEVGIPEPLASDITSIPDDAPIVKLEGAPRQVKLAEEEDGDIPIRYEATDDHGLREVHLVLRSGTREERRVLAHLDGVTTYDRGGHVLRARDPFVVKSHAPVEIRVEAKDNDPITGPKWGASEAITLLPAEVGEPEARRVEALRALRDAFVDSLAWRMSNEPPQDPVARSAFLREERNGVDHDAERMEDTLGTRYAGTRVASRLQAMIRGQMRKVRDAVASEVRTPSAASHGGVVKSSERLVLVTDAVVRGLSQKDARDTARQLAEVADDLALGASQMQQPGERERGGARMDASSTALAGGERSMKRLGSLGRDIGEIIDGDLLRVDRARKDVDYVHAELAARDLAARLREPDPSFGAQGGRASRGGGEAGGARGAPGDEGSEPDEVERAFNEAARDLDQLMQDHAGKIGDVEKALSEATSEEELKQLEDEAKKHAQAVRDAVKSLPSVGGGSDSWTSKGAAAKEHAEQMAKSLEQGDPAQAAQSGRSSEGALDEAKRMAARDRWLGEGDTEPERELEDARRRLEQELRWTEDKLEELRRRAAERAGKQLAQDGEDEDKLADRSRDLGRRGRDQGALPEPALGSLEEAERAAREAARSLKHGDADKGLEQQREAQRRLEMAKQSLDDPQESSERREGEGDQPAAGFVEIPKDHKGPDDFRQRVVKGLGGPSSGRLKDAVRRYAEGLLR